MNGTDAMNDCNMARLFRHNMIDNCKLTNGTVQQRGIGCEIDREHISRIELALNWEQIGT